MRRNGRKVEVQREGRIVTAEIEIWSKKSEIKVEKRGLKGDGKKFRRNRTRRDSKP